MGGVLTDLVRWVIDVVHSLGYVGVFALILAGSVYLPVPTELTLFGFLIGNGRLSFAPCCSRRRRPGCVLRSSFTPSDSDSGRRACGV